MSRQCVCLCLCESVCVQIYSKRTAFWLTNLCFVLFMCVCVIDSSSPHTDHSSSQIIIDLTEFHVRLVIRLYYSSTFLVFAVVICRVVHACTTHTRSREKLKKLCMGRTCGIR